MEPAGLSLATLVTADSRHSQEFLGEKYIFDTILPFLKNYLNVLFIFERQSASGGGAEREGDTDSEAELSAQSLTRDLNPRTVVGS